MRIRLLSFLTVLLAVLLAVAPATTAEARPRATGATEFTLDAEVLDGGQQVTSVTIDGRGLRRIDPHSLSTDTFAVHAVGTLPVPVPDDEVAFSTYDVDRQVTGVRLEESGDIVVDLASGFDPATGAAVEGASTLAYLLRAGRNVKLDLDYTVTQSQPIRLAGGRSLMLGPLTQGRTVDREVDRFTYGVSADGINYRLFVPSRRHHRTGPHGDHGDRGGHGRHRPALVVWLHGNGEGGLPGYYNNESQLLANRGALGPATRRAQAILGGAFVLAPQVPDTWYNLDQSAYAEKIKRLVDTTVARHRIDAGRIYLMGASAGGFMTVQMVSRYPQLFAAAVPTCPAIYLPSRGYLVTEAQVRRMADTPTWFVHAQNDPTVPYQQTSVWAHELLPGSILTLFPNVTWGGVTYNGHWSWIYTARNAPTHEGRTLWEWMAEQHREG